jgi:DMSO reductase anchor subunit
MVDIYRVNFVPYIKLPYTSKMFKLLALLLGILLGTAHAGTGWYTTNIGSSVNLKKITGELIDLTTEYLTIHNTDTGGSYFDI